MKNLVLILMLLYAAVTSGTRGTANGAFEEMEITYDNEDPITAVPGTSAVIGCTFTHYARFKPTAVVLIKCKSSLDCWEDDIIFNSEDVNATEGQFRGLVSPLEPDLSKKNCSIRINDLSILMSGSYRVGVNGQMNGGRAVIRTFVKKPIKVTGLRQPRIIGQTVVEEGGTLYLTCEAQSSPPSNVIWTKLGSDTPLMSGSQTATLVIPMVTPEHSGRYLCTANHLDETKTTFASVFVNSTAEIIYDNEDSITAVPGTSAVIGCTFNHRAAFKPKAVILTKCESSPCEEEDVIFNSEDVNATEGQFKGLVSLVEPDLSKKNCSIRINDLSISMSGSYQVAVNGQSNGRPAEIRAPFKKTINVTGLRQPRIIGETIVEEGGTLNLTCEAQSSPPSNVIWTEVGSDTPLMSGSQTATLVIPMVTTEHSGRYLCTANHLNEKKTTFTSVFVTTFQKTEVFLTAILAIVSSVGVVALTAIICHCHFRKSCRELRDQAEAPEVVITQDQQTGGGRVDVFNGHEQTIQEGGVAVALPLPQLQTSMCPPSAQGELPPPPPSTTPYLDGISLPAFRPPPPPSHPAPPQGELPPPAPSTTSYWDGIPPPPAFPTPPPPGPSHPAPRPSRSGAPPTVAPKPSRSGALPAVAPKPSRSGALPAVAPMPSRSGALPAVAPMPSRSGALPAVSPMPNPCCWIRST